MKTILSCVNFLFWICVFVIFSVFSKPQSDKEVQQLLNAPGAIEQFQILDNSENQRTRLHQDSPLVREAKAYALLLNPPVPVTSAPSEKFPARPKEPKVQPQAPTPKFKLYATSLYRTDPNKSLALISEPGKEERWIKTGVKIDYLEIKEILRDAVVYWDGQQLGEVALEHGPIQLARTDNQAVTSRVKNESHTTIARQTRSIPEIPPIKRRNEPISTHKAKTIKPVYTRLNR